MRDAYIRDNRARKRLFWIREAKRLGVNRFCRKEGLHKSHFYYWKRRFDRFGVEGLLHRSSRPKSSPRLSKTSLVRKILRIRRETERGADTIRILLRNLHGLEIPRSTIHKVLKRAGVVQKKERPAKKKHPLRYQAAQPGDRIQIDVKYVPYKIQEGTFGRAYQFTAIDDCTRVRFACIYDGYGIVQLQDFLPRMLEFFPFPVKLIQTDNHAIFTNKFSIPKAFRKKPKDHFLKIFCESHRIKHHLIEPGEPALNGKVERSHRTDQISFYDHHYFKNLSPLQEKFSHWMDYYNHHRPHWGIDGMTPTEKLATYKLKLGRMINEKKIRYSLAA